MGKKRRLKKEMKVTKKRGSYKKHKRRKYLSTFKTTTTEGKRQYQRNLMRVKLDIDPLRHWKRGPKPKRVLLKDVQADLEKLKGRV